jgi:hypothetical protein
MAVVGVGSAVSRSWWRASAAGATVVVGAAMGLVTNLITSKWTIALAVGLGVLLVVGVVLQVVLVAGEEPSESGGSADRASPPAIRQDARGRGRSTIIQAGGDVTVRHGEESGPLNGGKKTSQ